MLLHQRFIATAKKYGDKTAFIDCSTGEKVTYIKALIASLLLAKEFKKYEQGYTGIMIPTSAGCALAVLGTVMSGRTPVMINYSTGAAKNVKYAQKKCGFRTVITSKALLEKIDCPYVEGMVYMEDIMDRLTNFKKLKEAAKAKLPGPLLSYMVHKGNENDNVVILFTSGSEMEPKAVQLTHRNIAANIASISERYELTDSDRFLASLPFFHVFGLTANLWTPLYHGMTSITYANPLDFKTICEIVKREKPSLMVGTPSFFWGYLRKSEPGDFSSLRVALCGADKCPEALREAFLKKHGIPLYEAYGTTETSPGISGNYKDCNKPGSTGLPFPGVEVRIEDFETGKTCETGKNGKILVRGDLVMKGYLHDMEETSLHMRSGWYDTGDMGSLDEEGYLWHVGRLKRFVKIGGEMISLAQVENVLEQYLPPDVLCCVIEVPDGGVKGATIIAVVTDKVNERAILKKMAIELPNIALPKQFLIVEELPKMGSGKIDFRSITNIVRRKLKKSQMDRDRSRPG
jgi:acyl-[acyl-carrier-protein]-phospholipid O-acyltransferase/long-chain-fatty-acid--[acyl-carrier-protein] ligase